MKVNYLIVGQGLAGSLLCWELQKQGKDVLLIDNPQYTKASDVAAGLINPVVFRRMTRSWLIDELYPQLLETFSELEKELGIHLFYPLPIKKVLGEGDAEFWERKAIVNKLTHYINPQTNSDSEDCINAPYGLGTVEKSGRVALRNFISTFKERLQKMNRFMEASFDYEAVQQHPDGIRYKEITTDKLIFCEGHRASQNPFFQEIKFKHTKGEVLRLKTKNYQANFILNKSIFVMPEGDQLFRLGASYDWDDLSDTITDAAKSELQEKLAPIFTDDYEVVDHKAGVRPTTHDRRPVIGLHPKYPHIGIFNGLGSKGTMIGPYFARQFAAVLCGETTKLHPEVKLERYFKD